MFVHCVDCDDYNNMECNMSTSLYISLLLIPNTVLLCWINISLLLIANIVLNNGSNAVLSVLYFLSKTIPNLLIIRTIMILLAVV